MDKQDDMLPKSLIGKPGPPRNHIAELFQELKALKEHVKELEARIAALERGEG